MTETTESPDLRRVRADRDWYGYLTLENFQAVADRLRTLLDGRVYTWVACNEGLGNFRPEVRTGQRASKVSADLLAADHGHIMVSDTYGVWGLSTHVADQLAAHEAVGLGDRKRLAYVHLKYDRIEIEHYAPVGSRLYWVAAVESRDQED